MDGYARSALNYVEQTTDYFIPLVWSTWLHELSPGAISRFEEFYEFSIYPTACIGGTSYYVAWDCTSVNYQQDYTDQVNISSPLEIILQFEQSRMETFILTAEIEVTENITTADNRIFFAITNWVEYSTDNPWYFLVVAKSDEENFTLTNVGEIETFSAELTVDIQEDWLLSDLRAVAIVQNWNNKEVLQAGQLQFDGSNDVEDPIIGIDFCLGNYPNPFNPVTTISFNLTDETNGDTELNIYNTKGQNIKQLINDHLSAGQYSVVWNGKNEAGELVASGIYYYTLNVDTDEGEKYTSIKKLMLLK